MFKALPFLIAFIIIMVPRSAQAGCEEPTLVSQLSEAGLVAEQAFAEMDAEALLTQATLVRAKILPCVSEPLTKHDAASFHRLMAMEAFFNEDYVRASRELHASLLLEPGYTFPGNVAGVGHPLLILYKEAEMLSDGVGEKIYPPTGGYILVGGVGNAARYSETPVIMQVYEEEEVLGETRYVLRETRYVQPGEASPNWSGNSFGLKWEDLGIDVNALSRPSPLTKPIPWYITAGGAAVASGALYAMALHQKSVFEDPATSDNDRAGIEAQANGLATASLITGASAIVFTGFGVGFHVKFGPGRHSTTPHPEAEVP